MATVDTKLALNLNSKLTWKSFALLIRQFSVAMEQIEIMNNLGGGIILDTFPISAFLMLFIARLAYWNWIGFRTTKYFQVHFRSTFFKKLTE